MKQDYSEGTIFNCTNKERIMKVFRKSKKMDFCLWKYSSEENLTKPPINPSCARRLVLEKKEDYYSRAMTNKIQSSHYSSSYFLKYGWLVFSTHSEQYCHCLNEGKSFK